MSYAWLALFIDAVARRTLSTPLPPSALWNQPATTTTNHQFKMKIFNLFSISPVLSRPSSPAATASRHSSHTSSVTNRVNQPTQSVNPNQIMIVNEKKKITKNCQNRFTASTKRLSCRCFILLIFLRITLLLSCFVESSNRNHRKHKRLTMMSLTSNSKHRRPIIVPIPVQQ